MELLGDKELGGFGVLPNLFGLFLAEEGGGGGGTLVSIFAFPFGFADFSGFVVVIFGLADLSGFAEGAGLADLSGLEDLSGFIVIVGISILGTLNRTKS